MRFSSSIFGAALISTRAAPYANPFTVSPPLRTASAEPGCSLSVFNAALSGYGQVDRYAYDASSCEGPWDQIVLRLRGSVAGVQFDRWGAVWLGGVELLRLTTPEPDAPGISWAVDKDVSEYADVFARAGEAAIQVPNIVNSEYTGVLYMNVSFDFYKSEGAEGRAAAPRRHVVPLVDFAASSSPLPNAMCLIGSAATTAPVTLPSKNIRNMWVDFVASGHQCEEFWYTNLPDDNPQVSCGGGAYRELRLRIDGALAGVAYPFPVLYTGGVNPLLWRPLSGIESFDVEAYRFDVSPFLGVLNDGNAHNFTVDAIFNDNSQGYWCIDPVLVMEEDSTVTAFTGEAPKVTGPLAPTLDVQQLNITDDISEVRTSGSHNVEVVGQMTSDSGEVVENRVSIQLHAVNSNKVVGGAQVTNGKMHSSVEISSGPPGGPPARSTKRHSVFPYSVYDASQEDSDSFQLNSTVSFARHEGLEMAMAGQEPFKTRWHNSIDAGAVYNRSKANRSNVPVHTNSAVESFQVTNDASGLCYDRHTVAANGYVIIDSGPLDTCAWPAGVSFCGEKLCGVDNYAGGAAVPAPSRPVALAAKEPVSQQPRLFDEEEDAGDFGDVGSSPQGAGSALLVRRPADWRRSGVQSKVGEDIQPLVQLIV